MGILNPNKDLEEFVFDSRWKEGVICLGLLSDYMNRLALYFDETISSDLAASQSIESQADRFAKVSEYLVESGEISERIERWKISAQLFQDKHSKNPLRWLLEATNFGASSCQSVLQLLTLWNLERPESKHEKWDHWIRQSLYSDVYDLYKRASKCSITPSWSTLRQVADPLVNDTYKVQMLSLALKDEIQKYM